VEYYHHVDADVKPKKYIGLLTSKNNAVVSKQHHKMPFSASTSLVLPSLYKQNSGDAKRTTIPT
jgi:hypothetical protein